MARPILRCAADDRQPARRDLKAVFGLPEHARGTLRIIAPAPLAEALDWSMMTLRPGSLVDAASSHLARRSPKAGTLPMILPIVMSEISDDELRDRAM
jgi:hypothetical protein